MALSITIGDAAAEMSVSKDTVRDLIAKGELRAHKVGRCVRVYVESLADYQRRKEIKPKATAKVQRPRQPGKGYLEAMERLRRLGMLDG